MEERDYGHDGESGGEQRRPGRLVTGLYRTPEEAQRVYSDLRTRHGYRNEDIGVLMSDEARERYLAEDAWSDRLSEGDGPDGNKALEGLAIGGAVGGTLGAVVAGMAAVGAMAVFPGVVAIGPLAAALAGAGAGGATGGLFGALIGSGIPEERAAEYERGIREGGIVIGAHARDEEHARVLEEDYQRWGGQDIRR